MKKHKPGEILLIRSEEPIKFRSSWIRKSLGPSPQGMIAKFQSLKSCKDPKPSVLKDETLESMFLENIKGGEECKIHIEDLAGNSVLFWDIKLVNLDMVIKVTEPGRYEAFQKLRSSGRIPLYLYPPEAVDPTLIHNGNPDFYFGRSASEYTKSVFSTIKGPINITVTLKNPNAAPDAALWIHVISQV